MRSQDNDLAEKNKQLQSAIGHLLRYGVWIALSTACIGGLIYIIRHGNDLVSYTHFVEHHVSVLDFLKQTFRGALEGRGQAIIMLGIILLFLTPILRIILSLIGFIYEKDWIYIVITLIVICIIAFSVFYGYSH